MEAGSSLLHRACRLTALRPRSCPICRSPRHRPFSQATVLNRPSAAVATKPEKVVSQISDLPQWKTASDGSRLQPLDPWVESEKRRRGKRKADRSVGPDAEVDSSAKTEEAEYHAAITHGTIPDTALAKQVWQNWMRFPDCIVLTRVGKFYEVSLPFRSRPWLLLRWKSYFAPAVQLSSLLSLKLAYKRYQNGIWPFSGFPVTQLDKYLKILVQDLRQTVVLVEEYEDGFKVGPEGGRRIATSAELKDRRVGRVVTPGTLIDESWLNGEESRYLLAISGPLTSSEVGQRLSLAYTDASTGEFFTKETDLGEMEDELARITPKEVVLDDVFRDIWLGPPQFLGETTHTDVLTLLRVLNLPVSFASARRNQDEGGVPGLGSSSPIDPNLETEAITLLRRHLEYALRDSMPLLSSPIRQEMNHHMLVDAATLQALEIRHAIRLGTIDMPQLIGPTSQRGTLLSVLSRTATASGHRLLVRTLTAPSTDLGLINNRLALVKAFFDRPDLRSELREALRGLSDVVRLLQRFRSRAGDGRDIWETSRWIRSVNRLLARMKQEVGLERLYQSDSVLASSRDDSLEGADRLEQLINAFIPLQDLATMIEDAVDENAIMRGVDVANEEEMEGAEAAGDALVASGVRKESETFREAREREKDERESNLWWIRPE